MWVGIDLCLIPIGVGVSISPYIAVCQKIIKKSGLKYHLGPNGTAIEGEWDRVFKCVKACHEEIHKLEVVRIYTTIKLNTRTDKIQSFTEKIDSVNSKLINDDL